MIKKTIAEFKRGEDIKLTSNFSSTEFDCKCSFPECTTTLIDLEQVVALQCLRKLVGPIKITSGFRCKRHNKNVGGVPNSQHVKGTAADIVSSFIDIDELQTLAESVFDGVGRYDTFTHTDSRGKLVRFDKRKDK